MPADAGADILDAVQKKEVANSGTLINALSKICAAREYDHASISALTPEWKENFLKRQSIKHHGGL